MMLCLKTSSICTEFFKTDLFMVLLLIALCTIRSIILNLGSPLHLSRVSPDFLLQRFFPEKNMKSQAFLSDVGLLTTIYGKSCKLEIVTNKKDLNKGAVYENVVAQELNAHGYMLYYYNSKKNGELDFVIEHNGRVLPIEVKSGKDYERHSALDNAMKIEGYGIREACVLTNGNVKTD